MAFQTWLSRIAVDGDESGSAVVNSTSLPPAIGDPFLLDQFQVRQPVSSFVASAELARWGTSASGAASSSHKSLIGSSAGASGLGMRGWEVVEGTWELIEERGQKVGWVARGEEEDGKSNNGARIDMKLNFGPSPRLVLVYLQSYDQEGAIVVMPKSNASPRVQAQRTSARVQHLVKAPLGSCLEGKAICAFSRRANANENATR